MNSPEKLAIIGSGASAIYLLKHLLDEVDFSKSQFPEISIFEASALTGVGMPYSPETTDRYNMSNISSEELPGLAGESLAEWLRSQEPEVLEELDLRDVPIREDEVYNRLALGRYLNSRYRAIIGRLREAGITVHEHAATRVIDIQDQPAHAKVTLVTGRGTAHDFGRVVIATGHYWAEEDQPAAGYYASPWPISKLLPGNGESYNFAIGTLGASLSAFDVISSLAHRHGRLVEGDKTTVFHPHPGTEDFKIVMHAAQGLLPHLQFDQEEPLREIYRHVDREGMERLLDASGFLRLETFFDRVWRPALSKAFAKDGMPEMVELLADPSFRLKDFAAKMTGDHDYPNAFEGMREEMAEARESVLKHRPIHWKEVLDDLMYTLNFHAERMPAEDHLLLRSEVMPFVMNVIAAMPLPSGRILLALYDAGKLDIVSGKASVAGRDEAKGGIVIEVEDEEGGKSSLSYRLFIDCSGQKPLEPADYPFPGLVESGSVRKARAPFADPARAEELVPEEKRDHLEDGGDGTAYVIGGIDIDGSYRIIGGDGKANPRIHDIAFPHTSGLRPYSYGLQACNETSAILVRTWVEAFESARSPGGDPAEIYEKI